MAMCPDNRQEHGDDSQISEALELVRAASGQSTYWLRARMETFELNIAKAELASCSATGVKVTFTKRMQAFLLTKRLKSWRDTYLV